MATINQSSTYPHNLPAPLSTFIGRQWEIAEVTRLLAEHRLLTLTGPGGSGKTRLALRVAREMLNEFADGIWLIELASITYGDLIPQVVAAVLGVREQSKRACTDILIDHLRQLDMLLLIDNCEHLLLPCAELAESLLEACPNVQILATSREPLRIPGAVVYPVPPLSVPEPRPWRKVELEGETMRAYQNAEAVQLFIARAVEASPSFEMTASNGPWVADICRRLDGIPLAIELAAAWIRAISAREIAARLDDRFLLLTSQNRTVLPRHQTLEATLDWSYALLSDTEREMLQQLSVFSDGWTLHAAESVCEGNDIQESEALHVLSSLLDKSLIVVERVADERRYHLLETIRQYAFNKLEESGELGRVRDRHLDYYLEWAKNNSPHLEGSTQPRWVQRFDVEQENLRSALDWAQSSVDRGEKGLRLAAACAPYWRLKSYLKEGRERLAISLTKLNNPEPSTSLAWALLWSANLAYLQTDYQATKVFAERGLNVSQKLGPAGKSGIARAYDLLGELATEVGDFPTSIRYLEDALAVYRQLDDVRGTADMLMQLGWSFMRMGEYNKAGKYLTESLPLFRELDESYMLSLIQSGLGELAIRQNQLDRAEELLKESLALRRKMGERWGIAVSLGSLGWVAMLQRDFERMRDLLERSLEIRMEIGDQGGIAWCLEKLAGGILFQARTLPAEPLQQEYLRTVRVFAAATALRVPLDSAIDPADQPEYDRTIAELRTTLDDNAFETAWEEGSTMPLEDIIGLALVPVEDTSLSTAQTDKVKYGGLTPREREAAVLVAQGKSNREIAETMVVRVKTVETYITRILNKLGFDSRVQIATWAVQVGLAELDSDGGK